MVSRYFLELNSFSKNRSCRIVSSFRSKCNFANQNYYSCTWSGIMRHQNIQTDKKALNESICVLHFSSLYQLHVSLNIPDHIFWRPLATVIIKILDISQLYILIFIPSYYTFIAHTIKILISGRPLRSNFFVCILGFGNAKS